MLYFLLAVRAVITTVLTLRPVSVSLLVLTFPLSFRSEFLLALNISYRSVVCSDNRQPGLTCFHRECRPLRTANNEFSHFPNTIKDIKFAYLL